VGRGHLTQRDSNQLCLGPLSRAAELEHPMWRILVKHHHNIILTRQNREEEQCKTQEDWDRGYRGQCAKALLVCCLSELWVYLLG
jgi:hypothetical protein